MIESGDLNALQGWLAARLGLFFGEDKRDFLRDCLHHGMLEGGFDSPQAFLQALAPAGGRDWDRLIEALTVGETNFFRQWDHFRALTEIVLPLRIRARAAERRLRILSAPCASGEEPYSLAILLRERFPELDSWDIELKGVDVNAAFLAKAAQGVYSPWSLRDTALGLRDRFFEPQGRDYRVKDEIRGKVLFERHNLSEPSAELWKPGHYDFIFCRNMLMYFTPESASALVGRMAQALAPGGFLFLGYAETLRGLSQDFHLCHTHDTFYYQRPAQGAKAAAPLGVPAPFSEAAPAPALPSWDPSVTWVESIQKASERIAGLAARVGQAPAAPAATAPLGAAPGLEAALELMRRERFTEALEALPGGPGRGVDELLLRAVLLVNLGRAAEAEAACAGLLQSDELNAGAHYVMALCREHAGDPAAAAEEDRTAIYLDPSLAMPRLHLGLLSRRQGHPEKAAPHLEQALALLAREDASRILLFGGGFSREGLAQLCRQGMRSLEDVR